MTANKTILITGAMGQLGKRVARLLIERGHTVVALDVSNPVTNAVADELQSTPVKHGKLVPAFVNLPDFDSRSEKQSPPDAR